MNTYNFNDLARLMPRELAITRQESSPFLSRLIEASELLSPPLNNQLFDCLPHNGEWPRLSLEGSESLNAAIALDARSLDVVGLKVDFPDFFLPAVPKEGASRLTPELCSVAASISRII